MKLYSFSQGKFFIISNPSPFSVSMVGPWGLLGMDADLQHEPESVPDVAKPVLEGRGLLLQWNIALVVCDP